MRSRLHVKVSRRCNNNCVFCLDDRSLREDVSSREVAALLNAHRPLGEVLFTCGEPTLDGSLPRYVAMAKQAGYRSIGLVTNGRRLAHEPFCDALVDAGLTEVTVSIHGDSPRLHDGLTRAPGSFGQTRAALDNLARARQRVRTRGGLRVISSTVVCRANSASLRGILEMLDAIPVDVMVLNVVEPSGEALERLDQLLPAYADLATAIGAALEDLPGRDRVAVEGIPLCAAEPFLDRIGIREEIHLRQGDQLTELPPDRNHVKIDACAGCALAVRCPGVFAAYRDRRGTAELRRVE